MTDRIDALERYYSLAKTIDKWASFTFFAGAIFSILIPYSNLIQTPWMQEALTIIFMLFVLSYSVLDHYNGLYLLPVAEHNRRKQLLSDSFDVPLTTEKTNLYYNNEVKPSVLRLGANVMENAFFAKNVCNEMAKKERIKISIYALIWVLAIANRSTDLTLVLALTQFLFSGEILVRWIKIEVLRARNETLYQNLYALFLNRTASDTKGAVACILDAFASYETAKGAASIMQSSKVFDRLNPTLTEEWTEIRKQLKIKDDEANTEE